MDLKKAVKKVGKAAKSSSPLPSPAPYFLGFSQKVGGEGPSRGEGRGKWGKIDEKTNPFHSFNGVFGRALEGSRTGLECDTEALETRSRSDSDPNS